MRDLIFRVTVKDKDGSVVAVFKEWLDGDGS